MSSSAGHAALLAGSAASQRLLVSAVWQPEVRVKPGWPSGVEASRLSLLRNTLPPPSLQKCSPSGERNFLRHQLVSGFLFFLCVFFNTSPFIN